MLPPLAADSLSAQATRRSEGCSPEALSERAQVVWRLVRESGSRSYILQKGVQTESRDRCRGRQDLPHFVRLKRTVAAGDRSAARGDQQARGGALEPSGDQT